MADFFKDVAEEVLGSKRRGLGLRLPGLAARCVAAGAFALSAGSLCAFEATGPEVRVNTITTNAQSKASVAVDADGDYVVVWNSSGQDGSGYGIYAQRYNAAGVAQGAEFQVNTYTTDDQQFPSVAMDADGDFVVAWQSNGQDGNLGGIYARRYSAAGVALDASEFQLNTHTLNQQRSPSVAMDADGDFVVAWQSYGQDGSGDGIYARRYNAAGASLGGEFRVNSFTTSTQRNPSVAMDSDGDFVVARDSNREGVSVYGIYAQRYDAAGSSVGGEFRVNSFTTNNQKTPSVTMDADGDFVVAWQSYQDGNGNGYGIYAQRFSAAGSSVGGEFRVNSFTTGDQINPSVVIDADGDFVVVWQSYGQDGGGYGIYAQRFNAAGAAQGAEFLVNTYTTSNQLNPSLAMDAGGDFVVAWESSNGQDGSDTGIYAQRYRVSQAPSDVALSNASVAENSAANTAIGNLSSTDEDAGDTFTYTLVAGAGDTDNAAFQIVGNELRTLAALNFETKSSYSVRVRSTDASSLFFEKAFTITITNVNETPTGIALSNASIAENNAANTAIGNLSTTDVDAGDAFTYTLVAGTGDTDNASFQIIGNQLRTLAVLDFEAKASYSIRLRSTDAGMLSFEIVFTISATNANDATQIGSASVSDTEATTGQNLLFTASATDPDSTALTYVWTFSDGTTATGASVTKAFLAEGTYTGFVTVSDGQGGSAVSNTLTVTVAAPSTGSGIDTDGDGLSDSFEQAAGTATDAATSTAELTFKSLKISLSFAGPGKDSLTLDASLPTTAATVLNGKTLAVDIGGVTGAVTLDANGKSPKGTLPAASVSKPNAKTGLSRLKVSYKNGDISAELADEGLTNVVTPKDGTPATIPVFIGFDGAIHSVTIPVTYNLTKAGGKGSAK